MDLEAKKAEILLKGQNLEQYIGKLQNELGAAQQEMLRLQGELRCIEGLAAPPEPPKDPTANPVPPAQPDPSRTLGDGQEGSDA